MAVVKPKKGAFERIQAGEATAADYEVTYEGAVLATGERNGYHDSDFYATVWDEEEGKIKVVEYATTRFPTIGYGYSATPDATAEVIAKATAYQAEVNEKVAKGRAARELAKVAKGRKVTVARDINTRKIGKVIEGTKGVVFWVGPDHFGSGDRAGVELEGGAKHFFSEFDLEVEVRELTEEELEDIKRTAQANARYKGRQWGIVCGVEEGELEAVIYIVSDDERAEMLSV